PTTGPAGGIGRRSRFRFCRRKAWGFKSLAGHHSERAGLCAWCRGSEIRSHQDTWGPCSMANRSPWFTRRRFVAGAGCCAAALALPRSGLGQVGTSPAAGEGFTILRAQTGTALLRGPSSPATQIWGFEGATPGPLLRVKRGQELRVRLVNDLTEPTVVH